MSKQDQDAVLFLAAGSQLSSSASRREFVFLDKPLKRACFEALVGISSHRTDRIGALDMRFGKHDRPSPLTASIDSFAMILYNSIAEPLPDRFFVVDNDGFLHKLISAWIGFTKFHKSFTKTEEKSIVFWCLMGGFFGEPIQVPANNVKS